MTARHLDELSEFHLKDVKRLTPGTEIIIGHIPPLKEESKWWQWAGYNDATVFSTLLISFNDIIREKEEATKNVPLFNTPAQFVLFHQEIPYPAPHPTTQIGNVEVSYSAACDLGIERYSKEISDAEEYHLANFVIIRSDLEESGIDYRLFTSEAYQTRLIEMNEGKTPEDVFWKPKN